VSGVAALAKAVDPNLTTDQFAQILSFTSQDQVGPEGEDITGRDDFFGWGLLDAQAVLENVIAGFAVVPARIEAEAFTQSFELTSGDNGDSLCDTGNVDSLTIEDDNGLCSIISAADEWLEYGISVDRPGNYFINLRLASSSQGDVSIDVDGAEVGRVTVNGNGQQNYADYTISAQLSVGTHTLRINFIGSGIHFNYLDVQNNTQITIEPRKDAYIRGGTFASTSFGDDSNLVVKGNKRDQWTREAYLQFRIAEIANIMNVQRAVVRLYANRIEESLQIALHRITSNNSSESDITWNNTPDERNEVAITSVFTSAHNRYYEWDVTDYLKEKIGYNTFNVLIKERNDIDEFVRFNSSEASKNRPQLVVTYEN